MKTQIDNKILNLQNKGIINKIDKSVIFTLNLKSHQDYNNLNEKY
jgi:hypothetical protein